VLVSNDDFVKLPAFSAVKTKLRFMGLLQVMAENNGVPDAFQICRSLGLSHDYSRRAVAISVGDAESRPDSVAIRRRCAYRLAANHARLARGWACPPGEIVRDQYCGAVITGVEVRVDKGGSRIYLLIAYRVLTGRTAAEQVIDRCSSGTAKMIHFSLSGRPRNCGSYTPLLLVGLEAAISLRREMGDVKVVSVGVSRSQQTRNKKLTRERFRRNADCLFGFGVDCCHCGVGRTECRRSVLAIDTHIIGN